MLPRRKESAFSRVDCWINLCRMRLAKFQEERRLKEKMNRTTRRDFLRTSAGLIGALTLGSTFLNSRAAGNSLFAEEPKEDRGQIIYRTLGRTGLKVPAVSIGAMNATDPAVIERALDLGINYIDTARSYQGGNNEIMVGKVLSRRRDEAYIGTKVGILKTVKGVIASVEKSLKALRTDYIDLIQIHGIRGKEHLKLAPMREAFERLRSRGKVRFVGVTYHTNMTEITRALAKDDFWDTALIAYNYKCGEDLSQAIREAARAGKGIIAMKTQAGGYKTGEFPGLSPHQASLRWVLKNEGVACAIPGVRTVQQLEEDFAAMSKRFSWWDDLTLRRYSAATAGTFCTMCGSCNGRCPKGVSIQDVNRCLMYAEGYGDIALAKCCYKSIPQDARGRLCSDCTTCRVECPSGLDIRSRMRRAQELLGEV